MDFAVARACRQEFQFANNKFEQPVAPQKMARGTEECSGVELKAPNKWSKHSLLKNKKYFIFLLSCDMQMTVWQLTMPLI